MHRAWISIEMVTGSNTKPKIGKRPLLKVELLRAECARAEPHTLENLVSP